MAEEDLEEDETDAADDADGEEGEEGGGGKSSGGKKKLFIIIGAVLLLLIGGGAAVFFLGLLDPLLGDSEENTSEDEGENGDGGDGEAGEGEANVVFYDLDEMIINLNTSGRQQSLLKIKVVLEVASQADLPKVQALMPRVVDNFQTYLRELRIDDIRGSAGLYRLREELLTRVNIAVKPAKVNAILFKEMLIQ